MTLTRVLQTLQRSELVGAGFSQTGRNEAADKTKHKEGGSAYPSIGSSSAPVTNCNILFNVTLRKGSPENKAVMHHDCNF